MSSPTTRAEHPSLEGYLRSVLTPAQLERVLLVSFSQWEINMSVIAEMAATLHDMGMSPTVALWADEPPLRDVGWSTSRRIATAFASPSRDQRVQRALRTYGIEASAFASPPIRNWQPLAPLPQPIGLYRSAIRPLQYRGAAVGAAILQVNPDANTPVTDDHHWPEAWVSKSLRSFAFAFDQVEQLISDRGSTAAVVFNGRFLHDAAIAEAARAAGLPVLSYDYGGNDTDFDLTIDPTHDWSTLQKRMLTLYDTWPPDERDELGSSWFEDRRSHSDSRNSLFVESQRVGAGIDKPEGGTLVAYFSSSGDEISELDLDWSEYFYGQEGALRALAAECRKRDDTTLLVRTHPHKRMKPRLDVEEWHAAVDSVSPDIHLDEFSDVDSYTLMRQADVVVTYGSTTGVEAAYAHRPVIVMGPSAYDELGCATRVRSEEELSTALDERAVGWWPGAVSYGLMMRRRGFMSQKVESFRERPTLAGVELRDSRPLVMKLSDIWVRRRRARLTQA